MDGRVRSRKRRVTGVIEMKRKESKSTQYITVKLILKIFLELITILLTLYFLYIFFTQVLINQHTQAKKLSHIIPSQHSIQTFKMIILLSQEILTFPPVRYPALITFSNCSLMKDIGKEALSRNQQIIEDIFFYIINRWRQQAFYGGTNGLASCLLFDVDFRFFTVTPRTKVR